MTEMEPKQWHWQERYDATIPPREAMSQKRQVHKGIPYDKWLAMKQHKEAAMRATYNGGDEGDEANKRAKSDAAFREWCARKNRELREKMLTNEDQSPNKVSKPAGKPPSQHVNPKIKRKQTTTQQPNSKNHASEEQSTAAYAAWLARVKKEDRVRRAQRRQERKTRAQQNRETHKSKWKKKLVVCAYSTTAAI